MEKEDGPWSGRGWGVGERAVSMLRNSVVAVGIGTIVERTKGQGNEILIVHGAETVWVVATFGKWSLGGHFEKCWAESAIQTTPLSSPKTALSAFETFLQPMPRHQSSLPLRMLNIQSSLSLLLMSSGFAFFPFCPPSWTSLSFRALTVCSLGCLCFPRSSPFLL